MLGILNVILVMITVSNAGNRLYDDICATVSKSSANSTIARVECHNDSVIFDPKSQNGSLYNDDTDSWTGEIFACQCSCRLPYPLQNGQILTNGSVQHGKNLEYKCDDGKQKKIICFDGLLMMLPEYLEDNIRIAFRQKSLPEQFLNDFQNVVFLLTVTNISEWPVHESDVGNKYTDRLNDLDTALIYYLFNGEGFKLGVVDLKIHGNLECGTINNLPIIITLCISFGFMFLIALVCIIMTYCYPCKTKMCVRQPTRTTNLGIESRVLNDDVFPENEGNAIELIENVQRDREEPVSLLPSYAPHARVSFAEDC
ncbi:hypothetical protein CHS0354_008359 [Potamilus streckersoni]|uniref:Uncharacterized protein n=1 Tax=Potamilus streckersoni TaxID=2493646 RepID=A0AAE0RPJ4_9BIVA|nr:hypothetical protein CHS0354_008359 [Potamilus streckersoni]